MVQVRRGNHVRGVVSFAVWSFLVQVIVAISANDTSTCDENSALSTKRISDSRRGRPARQVTRLSQRDFQNGTYRIRDSGRWAGRVQGLKRYRTPGLLQCLGPVKLWVVG